MAFLTQSRFPRLWELFQYWAGASVGKRKMAISHLEKRHKRVLEVGCSVGNVGKVFFDLPGVHYTGIDIDPVVIARAKKKFVAKKNVEFLCEDLTKFAQTGREFDYILFAGMLHHCDDATCAALLAAGCRLAGREGEIIVSEPFLPEPKDTLYMRLAAKLERGEFVRKKEELVALIYGLAFLEVEELTVHAVALTPFFARPVAAHFGVFRCRPKQ